MIRITIRSSQLPYRELTLPARKNILLSDFLKQHCFHFSMPCSGNHICGLCKLNVTGSLSALTTDEMHFLTQTQLSNHIRLACFTKAIGDCTIDLDKTYSFIQNSIPDSSAVQLSFSKEVPVPSSGSFSSTTATFVNIPKTATLSYGIAVDIGTTTIASYLYQLPDIGLSRFKKSSLQDPILLSAIGEINTQRIHGSDVIARIQYNNNDTTHTLHTLIQAQLECIFSKHISNINNIDYAQISNLVITGNTTMLHFLMNLDTKNLAAAPFKPTSFFGTHSMACSLFPKLEHATLYLPPCIGAFVGADIVCSILASHMIEKDEISLLVDVGTNGEMALFYQNKLYTCSTAAGPAFEGSGITMGVTATQGAIDKVILDELGTLHYHTIGEKEAIGICGTGMIQAIALFLELGIIDKTGTIQATGHSYSNYIKIIQDERCIQLGSSDIYITQRDIRQIQMAKSAIYSGILTLLHKCNIIPEEIDTFYLCGGFGTAIDFTSANTIGLIPSIFENCTICLGNASAKGATLLLQSEFYQEQATTITSIATELSLATTDYFIKQYIKNMNF